MADPLSITASVIAVLQLTTTVTKYLREVKDAPAECKRLVIELSSLRGILDTLKDSLNDASDVTWVRSLREICSDGGPLSRLEISLVQIQSVLEQQLNATSGAQRIKNALVWPFKRKDIDKLIVSIEQQKTLLSLALNNDHLALTQIVHEDTQAMRADIARVELAIRTQHRKEDDQWSRTAGRSHNTAMYTTR